MEGPPERHSAPPAQQGILWTLPCPVAGRCNEIITIFRFASFLDVTQHVPILPPISYLGCSAGGTTFVIFYHRTGAGLFRNLNNRSQSKSSIFTVSNVIEPNAREV
jgi:hypothetical protein